MREGTVNEFERCCFENGQARDLSMRNLHFQRDRSLGVFFITHIIWMNFNRCRSNLQNRTRLFERCRRSVGYFRVMLQIQGTNKVKFAKLLAPRGLGAAKIPRGFHYCDCTAPDCHSANLFSVCKLETVGLSSKS
jgi:hypothetical protein